MRKLTNAQAELLREANCAEGTSCVPQYKPAQKLIALGLAEWTPLGYESRIRITDAGRKALEPSDA